MKLARLRGRILIGHRARSSLSRSERADEKTPRKEQRPCRSRVTLIVTRFLTLERLYAIKCVKFGEEEGIVEFCVSRARSVDR